MLSWVIGAPVLFSAYVTARVSSGLGGECCRHSMATFSMSAHISIVVQKYIVISMYPMGRDR